MLYKEHDSNGLPRKMETVILFSANHGNAYDLYELDLYLLANPLTNMDQKNCTRTLYFSCSPCAPERGAQLYKCIQMNVN